MYWNEYYESCSYGEAEEARFARWLEEYQQDRAAHQKARSTHPDPTKLDEDFFEAFQNIPNICGNMSVGPEIEVATNILLSGARATTCFAPLEYVQGKYRYKVSSLRYPEYVEGACCTGPIGYSVDIPDGRAHIPHSHFLNPPSFGCFQNDWNSGINLEDVVDLLNNDLMVEKGPTPEVEAFLDALAASGSVALLTNACCDGGGGFVLDQLLDLTIYRSSTNFSCVKTHRMGLRLLARVSFLSAEQALAAGCTHPFMALLRIRPQSQASYSVERISLGRRLFGPYVDDAILQVLYLTIFMYRRYPWPRQQQYRVETTIAKWVEWAEHDRHRRSIVTDTLAWAFYLPGFFNALLEDHSLWFLLSACEVEERHTVGRNRGVFFLNAAFGSRQRENHLIRALTNNRIFLAWVCCSKGGRHLLREVCRQRRRRVIQVRMASTRQAYFGPKYGIFCWSTV